MYSLSTPSPGPAGADGAPGAAGVVAALTRTATVSPASFGTVDVVLTAAAATALNSAFVTLIPNADHDADELDGYSLASVCGAGTVTVTLSYNGPIVGDFTFILILV